MPVNEFQVSSERGLVIVGRLERSSRESKSLYLSSMQALHLAAHLVAYSEACSTVFVTGPDAVAIRDDVMKVLLKFVNEARAGR